MSEKQSERELSETVELANQIVAFYEEVMGQQTQEIDRLMEITLTLRRQLEEARSLLRLALKSPVHPVN